MTSDEVIALLTEIGAISMGHFVLSSGRHSDFYVEKFRAFERPEAAMRFGAAIAEKFQDDNIDVVLAPAVGGIILGFATAHALGARSIFAEREGGVMTLRRGFLIYPDEKVLVVEDIITTGKSLREILPLAAPGDLAGIGALVDRSIGGEEWPARFENLSTLDVVSWPADDCPLCSQGVPTAAPGSRHL